jgi:hypothetical protein
MLKITLLSAIAFVLIFNSCATSPKSSSGKTGGASIDLHSKAAETTPNLKLKLKSIKAMLPVWGYGSDMGEIFNVFRTYNPATDGGQVDSQNIYNVIDGVQGDFNGNIPYASSFPASNLILCPFIFGDTNADTPEYYTHGADHTSTGSLMGGTTYHNTIAYRDDNGWFYGVLGGTMISGEMDQVRATKFKYNDSTGEIQIFLAYYITYKPSSPIQGTYGIKTKIIGNMLTHDFFVHVQKGNDITKCFQLIGKGVSQGTNAANYYVVYVENNNESGNKGYFKFPATADEAYLEDIHTNHLDNAVTNYSDLTNDSLNYGTFIQAYLDDGHKYTNSFDTNDFANGGLLQFN